MKSRPIILALALLGGLATVPLSAQEEKYGKHWSTSFERTYPFAPANTVLQVDNALGRIWVEADSSKQIRVKGTISVRARTDEALDAAREALKVHTMGNDYRRSIQVIGWRAARSHGWIPEVDLRLTVPAATSLRLLSAYGELISVSNVEGEIFVKTYKGDVVLKGPRNGLQVTSINGDILCELGHNPNGMMRLSTVNGSVTLRAARSSTFEWVAETLSGMIRGPQGLGGGFQEDRPTMYKAVVGSNARATIITASSTGDVTLSRGGATVPLLRPEMKYAGQEDIGEVYEAVSRNLITPPSAREYAVRRRSSTGNVQFDTQIGNIFLGEHRGNARLRTGAGEIVAGRVIGGLVATTLGGPINVGQVTGLMDLDTAAGDIYVVTTPRGGTAKTGGGNVVIRSAGAPLTISSGGGDILVEKTVSDVNAFTKSGDVRVRAAPGRYLGTRLETKEGNIIFEMPSSMKANVEITLLVEDEMADVVVSQFEGLSVVRDRFKGRGRIRAMATINGGGPKIELLAGEGQVHLLRRD